MQCIFFHYACLGTPKKLHYFLIYLVYYTNILQKLVTFTFRAYIKFHFSEISPHALRSIQKREKVFRNLVSEAHSGVIKFSFFLFVLFDICLTTNLFCLCFHIFHISFLKKEIILFPCSFYKSM